MFKIFDYERMKRSDKNIYGEIEGYIKALAEKSGMPEILSDTVIINEDNTFNIPGFIAPAFGSAYNHAFSAVLKQLNDFTDIKITYESLFRLVVSAGSWTNMLVILSDLVSIAMHQKKDIITSEIFNQLIDFEFDSIENNHLFQFKWNEHFDVTKFESIFYNKLFWDLKKYDVYLPPCYPIKTDENGIPLDKRDKLMKLFVNKYNDVKKYVFSTNDGSMNVSVFINDNFADTPEKETDIVEYVVVNYMNNGLLHDLEYLLDVSEKLKVESSVEGIPCPYCSTEVLIDITNFRGTKEKHYSHATCEKCSSVFSFSYLEGEMESYQLTKSCFSNKKK